MTRKRAGRIDKRKLTEMWTGNVPGEAIAEVFGVNLGSISSAASRMGLPPRRYGGKAHHISFCVSGEERRRLETQARARNLTMSEYIRQTIREKGRDE